MAAKTVHNQIQFGIESVAEQELSLKILIKERLLIKNQQLFQIYSAKVC